MTDIQRYSFSSFQEVCENGKCTLEPKAGGIACLFSDHESIVAELQEQVQKLEAEVLGCKSIKLPPSYLCNKNRDEDLMDSWDIMLVEHEVIEALKAIGLTVEVE